MKKPNVNISTMTNAGLLQSYADAYAALTAAKMLLAIERSPNGIRHIEAKIRRARKEVEVWGTLVLSKMDAMKTHVCGCLCSGGGTVDDYKVKGLFKLPEEKG